MQYPKKRMLEEYKAEFTSSFIDLIVIILIFLGLYYEVGLSPSEESEDVCNVLEVIVQRGAHNAECFLIP